MTRTDYQRFTARANINSQFTDWFNLEGNMGYTNDKSNQMMQAEEHMPSTRSFIPV